MSDKEWADHLLAKSSLPSDDFTFTDGSNYGLDGFSFDSEENEGVLDGARLPESKGLSTLPDGFTGGFKPTAQDQISLVDDVVGLQLGGFIDETSIDDPTKHFGSLVDLNWLDPTQGQDPERLPSESFSRGIPDLVEAWGVDRRTDGISLIPNKDKEIADYEESLKKTDTPGTPTTREARERVKDGIRWALRQADNGASPDTIKKGLLDRLGHSARLARKVVAQIEMDYGLAGNVFLTAAGYPDIHKSSRSSDIKAHLRKKRARYVLVSEGDKRISVWESIGKTPVIKVPWKKAFQQYGPELEASGYKVASKGSARDILQRAFLIGPQKKGVTLSCKPRDVRPSERVSVQEAFSQFRTAEAVPRQVVDNATRVEEAQRKKVLAQVAKWVKSGHLSLKDAHRLARSSVAPKMILRTATMLVKAATASFTSPYKGVGSHYRAKVASISREAAWAELEASEAIPQHVVGTITKEKASQRQKVLSQVAKWVKAGYLSQEDAHRLSHSSVSSQQILRTATILVKAATAVLTAEYEGVGNQYKTKAPRMSREAAWSALEAAEADLVRKARDLEEGRRKRLGPKLARMVQGGLLTTEEARKLVRLDKPVDEILSLAAAASQYKRPPKMKAPKVAAYQGPILEAAQVQRGKSADFSIKDKKILAASKKSGIQAKEFHSLLKWARIQMSEGTAGDELDQLFKLRFSSPLLKAAKPLIKAVRKEHEGLSGHVYVDAGAYASVKGTKGCEKGALVHRTGSLKTVLAIDKCKSCVLKNADGICTVYNKLLVEEPPVQDRKAYQRAAIKAANASDAEVTASLFAPAFDANEFSLVDPLQDISIKEAADPKDLGGFLWGDGLELSL